MAMAPVRHRSRRTPVRLLAGAAASLLVLATSPGSVVADGSPDPDGRGQSPTAVTPPKPVPAGNASARPAGKSAGAKQIGPVLIDPSSVDFGVVGPNTTVAADVRITNTTSKPIKVLAAVPTCTCTHVDITGRVIEPQDTLIMPMSMKTSASTGQKAAAVRLMLEGHPDPIEVSILSEVAYSVRATPPFIDVQQSPRTPQGKPDAPRPLTGTFALTSSDGKPFRVLSVLGAAPVFAGPSAGFNPAVDAPRPTYTVAYDFTAIPPQQVPCYIIVETDREDCPALDLRVRHENTHIRPAFKIAEFRSSVGRIAPGGSGHFDLEIKEIGTRRVTSVVSKSPALASVRLMEQKPDGESLLLSAEVTPASGFRGPLYFPVTITLDDGRSTDLWVFGSVR